MKYVKKLHFVNNYVKIDLFWINFESEIAPLSPQGGLFYEVTTYRQQFQPFLMIKHPKGPDEVIAKPPIWLKLYQMNIWNPSRKDKKSFFPKYELGKKIFNS